MRGRGTRQDQFNGLSENRQGPEVKTKQTKESVTFLKSGMINGQATAPTITETGRYGES